MRPAPLWCSIAWLSLLPNPLQAATRTVDAACPDALADPADAAEPFCTIQRGAQAAAPGDTVLVLPGVYREQVTPSSGAPGLPITFLASGAGVRILGTADLSDPAGWASTPTAAWSRSFAPASNPTQVFVDGARLTLAGSATTTTPGSFFYDDANDLLYVDVGGGNPGLGHVVEAGAFTHGFNLTSRSHIVVEGFEIQGQNTNGLRIQTGGEIALVGNTISYTGSRGINVESATGAVAIQRNDVSFADAIGIRVGTSSGVTIEENVSHDNGNHGLGLVGSSNNSIAHNVLHSNSVPGGASAVGVDLSTGSSSNLVFANEAFENQDSGFEVDGGSIGNVFVRNVSYANLDHGFDVRDSAGTRYVSNAAYGNANDGFSVERTASDTHLSNNIAVDNGVASGRFDLFVGNPPGSFSSDYDIFWKSAGGNVIRFGLVSHATVASFSSATGNEVHGVGADPRFVDPDAGDLRVQIGPAVDSADASAVGFSPEDHDGVLPIDLPGVANTGAGDPPFADRGAFEHLGESFEEPPIAHLAVRPRGRAPLLVTADASKSKDDVGIESYAFDFGDGGTAGPQPEPVATHTYVNPGKYVITLTVTDHAGFTSVRRKQLNVRKPRPNR